MLLEACPALVLNADFRPLSYFPLSLWSWQETIKAVFLGRVQVVQEDVAKVIREANDEFEAIMLDVDNGPSPQVDEPNAWLYTDSGLKAIRRSLRDRGRVAIWSAYEAPQFPAHMRRNGFRSDLHRMPAHKGRKGKGGTHHWVFTGWKT